VLSIIQSLKKKKIILVDIGCGDGNNIEELSFLSDQVLLYGVDYNLLRLVRAKKSTPQAQFILADATRPVLANNSVDIILLNHVIEHVQQDVELLETLYHYLAPGGYLLLGTPQEGRFIYQLRNKLLEPYIPFITDHVHFYTDKVLKEKNNPRRFCY